MIQREFWHKEALFEERLDFLWRDYERAQSTREGTEALSGVISFASRIGTALSKDFLKIGVAMRELLFKALKEEVTHLDANIVMHPVIGVTLKDQRSPSLLYALFNPEVDASSDIRKLVYSVTGILRKTLGLSQKSSLEEIVSGVVSYFRRLPK